MRKLVVALVTLCLTAALLRAESLQRSPTPTSTRLRIARPASESQFQRYLKRYYEYDRAVPLNARVEQRQRVEWTGEEVETSPLKTRELKIRSLTFVQEKISFDSVIVDPRHYHSGRRITALLTLPHKPAGPVPCLLLLHGYGDSKEDANLAAMIAARQGWAAFALDAMLCGERAVKGRDIYSPNLYQTRVALIQSIVDWRRGIDYLTTRPEIHPQRIGLLGASMGGIMGTLLAGVDQRVRCAVIAAGGADWGLMASLSQNEPAKALRRIRPELTPEKIAEILAPVDPLNFIDKISPRPVLLQHGRSDISVPPEAAQLLWERAREPKEMDWYDVGHYFPRQAFFRILDWLRRKL